MFTCTTLNFYKDSEKNSPSAWSSWANQVSCNKWVYIYVFRGEQVFCSFIPSFHCYAYCAFLAKEKSTREKTNLFFLLNPENFWFGLQQTYNYWFGKNGGHNGHLVDWMRRAFKPVQDPADIEHQADSSSGSSEIGSTASMSGSSSEWGGGKKQTNKQIYYHSLMCRTLLFFW